MIQASLDFDVCERKHGGHRNSVRAFERHKVSRVNMRGRVRIFVDGCGFQGTTLKQIAENFDKPLHALSGRISELKRDGLIFDSGRDEGGFSILVSRKEWVSGSVR